MADIRYDRITWILSAALLSLMLVAQPVQAQQDRQDPFSRQPAESERGSSMGLPSWAEPGTRSAIEPPDNTPDDTPPPPGPPTQQVPIDGGLGLLAVAGAGYAVSRLRRKDDEDEDATA